MISSERSRWLSKPLSTSSNSFSSFERMRGRREMSSSRAVFFATSRLLFADAPPAGHPDETVAGVLVEPLDRLGLAGDKAIAVARDVEHQIDLLARARPAGVEADIEHQDDEVHGTRYPTIVSIRVPRLRMWWMVTRMPFSALSGPPAGSFS